MIAYTGIETVSNLAEEARDPRRTIPASIRLVAIAVFAIYFTLPLVALSALPVYKDAAGDYVTQARAAAGQGGFENDPVLGLVENLGLHGCVLERRQDLRRRPRRDDPLHRHERRRDRRVADHVLDGELPAAARRSSAGSTRASRRRGSSLIVFAGVISIAVLLPGKVDFLGTMYSFGAMLSFTIAHAVDDPAAPQAAAESRSSYRARPNLRIGGLDLPLFAILGGSAPRSPGSSSSSRTRRRATPGSPGSRRASSSTGSTARGVVQLPLTRDRARADARLGPSLRSSTGRSSCRS